MEEQKIRLFKILAVFFVVLSAAVVYSIFWGPAKKYGDSLYPARTVWVSAEGKVTVSPDIAKVSFSVVSEGADPRQLADDNNRKMEAAIKVAEGNGVKDDDVKTTQYNLYPRYEYDEKSRKTFISGYVLTQTVLVKIRDLDKVAEILSGLPETGINQIGQVSFEIDDPEKFLREARQKAFAKAGEKAGEMAAQNGVRLGKIITFSEYAAAPGPKYYEGAMGGGEADFMRTAPPIQPGTEELTAQVSIQYEVR